MRRTTSGRPIKLTWQDVLSVDVRAFIESHLRALAQEGRLSELARSRDALARLYRTQGNNAAVYCLAVAPDFSLVATPGSGFLLRLRRSGHLMSWTQSELLKEAPDAATESLAQNKLSDFS